MNSVLLGGKNQNIRVHKQRKKGENKEPGETQAIWQTLVAFGDMQQQQKCISDGKQLQDITVLRTLKMLPIHNGKDWFALPVVNLCRRCKQCANKLKKHEDHVHTRVTKSEKVHFLIVFIQRKMTFFFPVVFKCQCGWGTFWTQLRNVYDISSYK